MARPTLIAAKLRSCKVGVRLRPAEAEAVRKAARASGVTPSTWAHRTLVAAATSSSSSAPLEDREALREAAALRRELHAIGTNLNRVVHIINIAENVRGYERRVGDLAREVRDLVVARLAPPESRQ